MVAWLPTSPWLTSVGAEYGIGTPSVLGNVRLPTPPPAFTSTMAFTAYVQSVVGTSVPSPPSKNTFYAFVLPAGSSFSDPLIGTLCSTFTGYHDATSTYTFAVIGTCPNRVPGLTDAEQVERVLSHELIEALTDPFGDGYAAHDPNDPWTYVGGGEVADVCDGYVRQNGFLAVQSWSNAAATSGADPCQPQDPTIPYFNVAPMATASIHLAAGASATVAIIGWSTAATSDWTTDVSIVPFSFAPTATLVPSTLNNGIVSQLTISAPSSASSGSVAAIFLRSRHPGDTVYSLQPMVVSTL